MDKKRPLRETLITKPWKRVKSISTATMPMTSSKGQQSLKVFLKPKAVTNSGIDIDITSPDKEKELSQWKTARINPGRDFLQTAEITEEVHKPNVESPKIKQYQLLTPRRELPKMKPGSPFPLSRHQHQIFVERPPKVKVVRIISLRTRIHGLNKLFTKPAAPRCEGHNEPCISLMTKKSRMNCGRSFCHLDVSSAARAYRGQGKEHWVAVSDFYLV